MKGYMNVDFTIDGARSRVDLRAIFKGERDLDEAINFLTSLRDAIRDELRDAEAEKKPPVSEDARQ